MQYDCLQVWRSEAATQDAIGDRPEARSVVLIWYSAVRVDLCYQVRVGPVAARVQRAGMRDEKRWLVELSTSVQKKTRIEAAAYVLFCIVVVQVLLLLLSSASTCF